MDHHLILDGLVADDSPNMDGKIEDRWSKYTPEETKLVAEAKRKQKSTTESAKAALKVGNWLQRKHHHHPLQQLGCSFQNFSLLTAGSCKGCQEWAPCIFSGFIHAKGSYFRTAIFSHLDATLIMAPSANRRWRRKPRTWPTRHWQICRTKVIQWWSWTTICMRFATPAAENASYLVNFPIRGFQLGEAIQS